MVLKKFFNGLKKTPWQGKFLGFAFLLFGLLYLAVSLSELGSFQDDPSLVYIFAIPTAFFLLLSWGYLARVRWIVIFHSVFLFLGAFVTLLTFELANLSIQLILLLALGIFAIYCNLTCLGSSAYKKKI